MVGGWICRHGLLNLQVSALINELSLILKRKVNGYLHGCRLLFLKIIKKLNFPIQRHFKQFYDGRYCFYFHSMGHIK